MSIFDFMNGNTITLNPNKLFTKMEYSKVRGVSRPTIDKYIKEKRLKAIKINGAVLILAD